MNTSYELLTVCRPRGAIPSSATDFFLGVPNLDLYVYDPYGRKVAYDDGPSDNCSAQFYAGYTAKYTFKVVNRSNFTGNEYLLTFDWVISAHRHAERGALVPAPSPVKAYL